MQIKTPPPVPSIATRIDKTENLRTFIAAALHLPRSAEGLQEITLVARSAQSPVALALVSLGSEIAANGLAVRAIFGSLEPEKTPAGWSAAGPAIAFQRDLRWAKNPRLADAHEQLVVGPTVSWVGDCLRRDPFRRDAYEQFAASDANTARTLSLSFSRLWEASLPLEIRSLRADLEVAPSLAALAPDAAEPALPLAN